MIRAGDNLKAGDTLYRRTRPDSGVPDVPYKVYQVTKTSVWLRGPFEADSNIRLDRQMLAIAGYAVAGNVVLYLVPR
jgi:hypothetical protein